MSPGFAVDASRGLSLSASDFELFDVPQRFAQDKAALDARWKALQREAHPDRFAAQGAAAQRQATQWSVRINEAYRRLSNPLKRAVLLCEMAGHPINAENNTAMPVDFLLRQMQWREALDDAASPEAIGALAAEVAAEKQQMLNRCASLLDDRNDPAQAVQVVRSLMFLERFASDIDTRLHG